ncbi:MAG: hypothetical protein U9R05_01905 [Chloroflexota bacterium]|nr:hypothetical protein [Chloroflexota bacterium]
MRDSLRPSSGQALSRRTVTFIVRVWAEYLEQTPSTWRGEVKHIQSEEVMYFGNLSELDACIQRCTITEQKPNLDQPEPKGGLYR